MPRATDRRLSLSVVVVVFSLVYFDLFKLPFLPSGWCVVFAIIGMLIFFCRKGVKFSSFCL